MKQCRNVVKFCFRFMFCVIVENSLPYSQSNGRRYRSETYIEANCMAASSCKYANPFSLLPYFY